jgi:hypothetical protein
MIKPRGVFGADAIVCMAGDVFGSEFATDPSAVTNISYEEYRAGRATGIKMLAKGTNLERFRKATGDEDAVLWAKEMGDADDDDPQEILPEPERAEWFIVPISNPDENRCWGGDVFGAPDINPSSIDNYTFQDCRDRKCLGVCIDGAAGMSLSQLRADTAMLEGVLFRRVRQEDKIPERDDLDPNNPVCISYPHFLAGIWKEVDGSDVLGDAVPRKGGKRLAFSRFTNWQPSFHGREAPLP